MSNAIFPTFPGLAWSVYKTPTWSTAIQKATSGKEVRMANQSRPIWNFSLSYEVLRGASAYAEYQTLLAFYNARQGAFDSFLLSDASDNKVTNQVVGTGDGVTTTWPLLHSIGAWSEPVGSITNDGVPSINGVVQIWPDQFTVPDGVHVVFATPPPAGAVITWTGTFYYRVRFTNDTMEFEQFMKDFWLLKKCDLTGVI